VYALALFLALAATGCQLLFPLEESPVPPPPAPGDRFCAQPAQVDAFACTDFDTEDSAAAFQPFFLDDQDDTEGTLYELVLADNETRAGSLSVLAAGDGDARMTLDVPNPPSNIVVGLTVQIDGGVSGERSKVVTFHLGDGNVAGTTRTISLNTDGEVRVTVLDELLEPQPMTFGPFGALPRGELLPVQFIIDYPSNTLTFMVNGEFLQNEIGAPFATGDRELQIGPHDRTNESPWNITVDDIVVEAL
jgi:hypothetical protein